MACVVDSLRSMTDLANLTFFCALCNVRHVRFYRCAAVRGHRQASDLSHARTLDTEAVTGAYRTVR